MTTFAKKQPPISLILRRKSIGMYTMGRSGGMTSYALFKICYRYTKFSWFTNYESMSYESMLYVKLHLYIR